MIFLGCSISIFIDTYNIEIKYLFDKKRLFYLAILSLLIASLRFSSINIGNFSHIIHNGKYIIPKPEYTTINVSDKFKLNIPKNGRCYNIDLPCAPYYKKGLTFIIDDSGFPKRYFYLE